MEDRFFNKKHTEAEIEKMQEDICACVFQSETIYNCVNEAKNMVVAKVVDKYHPMPDYEKERIKTFLRESIDVDVLCDTNHLFYQNIDKVAKSCD